MMYWLASLHGIRGMLYWSVDHWAAECGRSSSVNQHPPACQNISRLSGSARTNFVNNAMDGDGTLVYPGSEGMVSSIRLEAITDGIEDWQLLQRVPTSSRASLVRRLVRNGTDWTANATLLEKTRRDAAGLALRALAPAVHA